MLRHPFRALTPYLGCLSERVKPRHEEEIAQLRAEIERLRQLVVSAAEVLEKAGQEREGWRLRRALGGE